MSAAAASSSRSDSGPGGFWSSQPAWRILLLSSGGVGVVGVADHLTGPELSFALFYLLPIALAAWFAGRGPGLFISGVSAATWHWVNTLTAPEYQHPSIPVWNALTRLCFFVIVTLLLVKLHATVKRERQTSRTDFLTSALNSRAFYEAAAMEIARSKRRATAFSLAYIDLDNFKSVNDRFGHATGDDLLKVVVVGLRGCLRVSDVVARLGGDEFAVLLPETDEQAARVVVAKLRERLLEAMREGGWPVTFSIGVITCLRPPASVQTLVTLADNVMYGVKASNKNAVAYADYDEGAQPTSPSVEPA